MHRTIFALLLAMALAAPGVALAAKTPCGFLNGQYDIAGRTYAAEVVWPQRAIKGLVTFNADCSTMLSLTGQDSVLGTWLQKDGRMAMEFVGLSFLGEVSAAGEISGQMVNSTDDVGRFKLIAPSGGVRPSGLVSGDCGQGDASNPYVAGHVYYGKLTWAGDGAKRLTLTFRSDCSVDYRYDDGSVGKAFWSQTGQSLFLDVNGGYATYTGSLANGVFVGKVKNQNGDQGVFRFQRKP